MTRDEIAGILKSFVSEAFPNPDRELSLKTDLLDDWFIDSLGIIQVVMFIESRFRCEMRPQDIISDHFQNIAALTDLIFIRLAEKDPQ